jgi:hypothetical protein
MSVKVLQINFRFSIPAADLVQAFAPAVQMLADTPGLRWKVWLMNEAEHEGGGIYLFEDAASAEAYLAGPIVASLKANPVLSDMSTKVFDVPEEFSLRTRAPIREVVAA